MSSALTEFEYWIRSAWTDVQRWQREPAPAAQALHLKLAASCLTRALTCANKLNDRDRRAYCMRNLSRARALRKRIDKTIERSAA